MRHECDICNRKNNPLKLIFLDEAIQTDLYDNIIISCYKGLEYDTNRLWYT